MPENTPGLARNYASHYADVHLLLRQGDEILMSRRRQQQVFPGMWQIPAGLMEEHEPARAAAAREFAEETSATVDPDHLRFVHVMHHVSTGSGSRRIAFFFETDRWHGSIGNPERDKCEGWEWHKATSLPEPLPPYLAVALQHIADGTPYSEYAWPANTAPSSAMTPERP
ncbi:NUDIX domain-containing protein [Streptomyces yangpuensis]|uniref:NUDIX domain-containing protein n=1 Tax=Streptomyces yangpuensis TaxID=1648182 RepID=UPI003808E9B4